jgi:hypothetical protein
MALLRLLELYCQRLSPVCSRGEYSSFSAVPATYSTRCLDVRESKRTR